MPDDALPREDVLQRDDALQDRARAVRLMIFDVDGVLTDGRLYFTEAGAEMKAFHTLDGHGMKMLMDSGVRIALLTGRSSGAVAQATPVVLDLAIHGEGKDPWGNVRSGFTAKTTINRKDYGLTWNQTLETGQLLVGEEVEIVLEVEGLAQTE